MSFTRTISRRSWPVARFSPWSRTRARARRRRRILPRARLALVLLLAVGGLLFGGWMWLRDSSLVAVSQVTITGESGAEAGAIRSALRSAARNMTTLDVQMSQLRTAVAPFPEVRRLRVRTGFPHRMVIEVVEQRPVGILEVDGRAVPVAADGTILRAVAVSSSLPAIPLSVLPVGRHLREGRAADAVALLAAAPYQLLSRISQVTTLPGHGLVVQLRNGPSIYFGAAARLSAKWVAATEVLGDPGSAGAAYIDVTDSSRPVAGTGGSATAAGAGAGGSATPAGTAGSTTAAGATSPSSTAVSGPATTVQQAAASSNTGG